MEPKRGPVHLGFVVGHGVRLEVFQHRSGCWLLVHPGWLTAK